MCDPDEIFLSFCDYIDNAETVAQLVREIDELIPKEHTVLGRVRYLAEGPSVTDIYDVQTLFGCEKWYEEKERVIIEAGDSVDSVIGG